MDGTCCCLFAITYNQVGATSCLYACPSRAHVLERKKDRYRGWLPESFFALRIFQNLSPSGIQWEEADFDAYWYTIANDAPARRRRKVVGRRQLAAYGGN
jgi:hypothetical protein